MRPLLLSALLGLCALSACTSPELAPPKAAWVRADRATFDAIGVKFQDYVQADDDLDLGAKGIWLAAVDDWRARLESAEVEVGAGSGGGGQ